MEGTASVTTVQDIQHPPESLTLTGNVAMEEAATDGRDGCDALDNAEPMMISAVGGDAAQICQIQNQVNDDAYPMNRPVRGLCLIIYNQKFVSLPNRPGAGKDAKDLEKCFKSQNFTVKRIKDGNAAQICNWIKTEVDTFPHKEAADAVCVCFSTHGDYDGVLHASGGKNDTYRLDTILPFFSDINCPGLAGKPKLFFIQACRGTDFDHGVEIRAFTEITSPDEESAVGEDSIADDVDNNVNDPPDDDENMSDDGVSDDEDIYDPWKDYNVTTMPDFLIAYSTVPFYYSFRHSRRGSVFIRFLVKALTREPSNRDSDEDLLSVLTSVSRRIAYEYTSRCRSNPARDGKKQVPCIHSTLTRKVFFSPRLSVMGDAPPQQLSAEEEASIVVDNFFADLIDDEVDISTTTGGVFPQPYAPNARQPDVQTNVPQEPSLLLQFVNAPEYLIMSSRRGRCLIINNQRFETYTGMRNRDGFERDAQDLKRCFDDLAFDTQILPDFTVSEILTKIKQEVNKMSPTAADAFCICILTHGSSDGMLWARDGPYSLQSIFNILRGDLCPQLAGRAKLFFIHACQCGDPDPGRYDLSDDDTDGAESYTIPAMADFLVAYSSLSEYDSFGEDDTLKRSWFVQSLVDVLTQSMGSTRPTCKDLRSMLTTVCRQVANRYPKVDITKIKRVPCISSTLTRKVMF